MSKFTERILKSLLPKGSLWSPSVEGDFQKYLEGQADNYDAPITFLGSLSEIRNPKKTPVLDDLEREYGKSPNPNATDAERRNFLNSFAFGSRGAGNVDDMERRLNQSGFDVNVYVNDPAQDPEVLINEQFQMVAGGDNAYAGRVDAFSGRIGGELIVNGDKFFVRPEWSNVAGGQNAYAGRSDFFAGGFNDYETIPIEYPIPDNPNDWPLLFFVGGDVTRDVDGKILTMETITQPKELRDEYLKILLRYKPLHTWVVSFVEFL